MIYDQSREVFSYRRVHGWTHDTPALICSLTEYALYFRNPDGTIECVDDHEEGIDYYEDREGDFCILEENYEPALMQIEEHDEMGVEH